MSRASYFCIMGCWHTANGLRGQNRSGLKSVVLAMLLIRKLLLSRIPNIRSQKACHPGQWWMRSDSLPEPNVDREVLLMTDHPKACVHWHGLPRIAISEYFVWRQDMTTVPGGMLPFNRCCSAGCYGVLTRWFDGCDIIQLAKPRSGTNMSEVLRMKKRIFGMLLVTVVLMAMTIACMDQTPEKPRCYNHQYRHGGRNYNTC